MQDTFLVATLPSFPKQIKIPNTLHIKYALPRVLNMGKSQRLPNEVVKWIMGQKQYNPYFKVEEEAPKPQPVVRMAAPRQTTAQPAPHPDIPKININAAGKKELEQIPFLTGYMIDAILEYRKTKPFETMDELLRVPGIGKQTQQKLAAVVEI